MARDFSPEDLRAWQRDPRGAVFWEELREKFSEGVSKLRATARAGDSASGAYTSGQLDTIEEVLQIPDILIQEQVQEAKDRDNVEGA